MCDRPERSREAGRSGFRRDLDRRVVSELSAFTPRPDYAPIPDGPLSADWLLTYVSRSFWVFGVDSDDRARRVVIALEEFRQAGLPGVSLIVLDSIEDRGRREEIALIRSADKVYPTLRDFSARAAADLRRLTRPGNGGPVKNEPEQEA